MNDEFSAMYSKVSQLFFYKKEWSGIFLDILILFSCLKTKVSKSDLGFDLMSSLNEKNSAEEKQR